MLMVGVRDLKNQLSQYLQYVKDGEKVIITEHNKIIAEISVPVQKKEDNIEFFEKELEKLNKEGEIILAKRNKSNVEVVLYTFDKTMHELAEHYRFKTNKLLKPDCA
jgi:prevent-host-death family protein